MTAAWNVPRHLALIALAGLTGAGSLSAAPSSAPAPAPPADAAKAPGSTPEAPRRITLDFVEAEIADIAKALSVQASVNIACSANAKGKITLRQKGITLDEALRLISRLAGLDFRRVGETFVIGTPDELRTFIARSGVTDIWTPRYLNVAEAKDLVRAALPFVTVQVQEQSKRVVLLGTAEDVAAARSFLTTADVPTAAAIASQAVQQAPVAMVTETYTVKYLDPGSALGVLTGKDPEGKAVGGSEGGYGKAHFPGVNVWIGPEPYAPKAARFKPLSTDSKAISSAAGGKAEDVDDSLKSRTLVLRGPDAEVREALAFLQRIDVAPPQVLIEARLVEISPDKYKELGLLFNYSQTTIQELRAPRGQASTPEGGDQGFNFGKFIRTPFDIDINLSALQEKRDARLLANPRVAVVDGQDASVFIGDLLRFRVLSGVTAGGNEQFTVQEVPVGIALLVRPRVHEDGFVTLKVHPVVSTVTSFVGPERIPQTATREADSTIRMKDGETVVIGGLMREEDITVMSKVPGLGDLPLIGKLFTNKTNSKKKSEVTVFLTARIMR